MVPSAAGEWLPGRWVLARWILECVDIEAETHDVKTFYFRVRPRADGIAPLCLHRPGQFVTLRLCQGDRLVPRSYTISSSPSRPMLMTMTIKRDPKGLVSRFMHDVFAIGDLLPVNGPSGTFDLMSVTPRRDIVMLSGGSGITPLMSMLRYIHDMRAREFNVTFLHSARTAADIIFRDELELIRLRTGTRLGFICEHDAEPGMDEGFLTGALLERHVANILDCTVLTCGPPPYMNAVKAMLGERGFDMANYHEESFGNPEERENPEGATPNSLTMDTIDTTTGDTTTDDTATGATTADRPSASLVEETVTEAAEGPNEITFSLSEKTVSYTPGQTILEVATREGIAIPTNCQMGLCGTCKTRCHRGEVRMDDTEGLEPGEQDAGLVLTCCGRPRGPVSIEF